MKHPYLNITFSKPSKKSKNIRTQLQYLFFNNKSSMVLTEHELELFGILDMIDGLNYHYKNFRKKEIKYIASLDKLFTDHILEHVPSSQNIIHEIIAYINRLGQIYYLLISQWFKKYVNEEELVKIAPTILALMPFRNKFTAHRSIDAPKGETSSQMASHASIPLGIPTRGKIGERPNVSYTIKIQKTERANSNKNLLAKYHKSPVGDIEYFTEDEVFLVFIPTKHHEKICLEITSVLKIYFEKSSL